MKLIPLSQGKVTVVDDDDYERVSQFKWFAVYDGYNWYAATKKNRRNLGLHRFLMNPPRGLEVDHRDQNGLNNRRSNLRICTHRQNMANRKKVNRYTCRFKGVSWKKKNKLWCAQISALGNVFHLGLFKSARKAARAYDAEAVRIHGEFATTNAMLGLL